MNATAAGSRHSPVTHNLRGNGDWLFVLLFVTVIEILWWSLCWRAGIAPAPHIAAYLAFGAAGLLAALVLRLCFAASAAPASWMSVILGTLLVAVGASFFLPLKYALPQQLPFWLDGPLAFGERQLFGTDPWRIADRLLGWALVPIDRIYGCWLPVQSVVLFSVMMLPPSSRKSQALIAYTLAWFVLGVVAAVLCASAGPIFYDRLLGGHQFAALADRVKAGAWMTRAESDAMWASFASSRPGLIAGMSAMPSLHVAISFWIWLTARALAPRGAPLALAYAFFMWIASVQLGWHYVSDGLAGAIGMLALWLLAARIAQSKRPPSRSSNVRLPPEADIHLR